MTNKPGTAFIRAVITHSDQTTETTDWHSEGSAEALNELFAILQEQTRDDFSLRLEKIGQPATFREKAAGFHSAN